MLSARAGEEARIEGVEAGADDYLTKPFTARELIARVDAQLKMARMRREAAEQKAALTMEINRARQFAGEALEHVPVAFCTMDRDYCITYMNAAAMQLAALSGKPHMGARLWDLYPELIGSEVESNLRRAMVGRSFTTISGGYATTSNPALSSFMKLTHRSRTPRTPASVNMETQGLSFSSKTTRESDRARLKMKGGSF